MRRLAAELGENAAGFEADVTDLAALEAANAEAVDHFGGIDVVIANASVAPTPQTLLAMDPAEFRRVVDVDLFGVWNTLKASLRQVVDHNGYILIISSMYACFNGMLSAPYAASKAAVEQLARALRVELAPHGATAGVAYLGFFETELLQPAFASPAARQAFTVGPAWLTRPLPAGVAAEAIVHGIETRAARVMAPRWMPIFLALRGLFGPIDTYLASSPTVHQATTVAEETSTHTSPTGTSN